MTEKVTKQIYVRVGRSDDGEPCITAYGEDDHCSLEDGTIDTNRPYRDCVLAVSFEMPGEIPVVLVDLPEESAAPLTVETPASA